MLLGERYCENCGTNTMFVERKINQTADPPRCEWEYYCEICGKPQQEEDLC